MKNNHSCDFNQQYSFANIYNKEDIIRIQIEKYSQKKIM